VLSGLCAIEGGPKEEKRGMCEDTDVVSSGAFPTQIWIGNWSTPYTSVCLHRAARLGFLYSLVGTDQNVRLYPFPVTNRSKTRDTLRVSPAARPK
jgi:hypothetical protein